MELCKELEATSEISDRLCYIPSSNPPERIINATQTFHTPPQRPELVRRWTGCHSSHRRYLFGDAGHGVE